ncbi:MAG: amidohydrolase [Chloroflexota bacterium]
MSIADIILKNANVITMNPLKPRASTVATGEGRILFVGNDSGASDFRGAKTSVIDLSGKTVLPGFNDAHCHLFSFIRKLMSLDVSPEKVKSIVEVKALIRREAESTPRGRWISATDFSDFYVNEKRYPTRRELDEVSPDHPVVVAHTGLHVCVLNSLAFRLAGIGKNTPAPPGALIERDATGEPTGVLHEMLGYIREKVIPPLSENEIERGMSLASAHFLALGITSVQDATVVNDPARWQILNSVKDKGIFVPRLFMMFGYEHIGSFREMRLTYGSGDEGLRLGGVKIILTESTGTLYPEPGELDQMVTTALEADFPVALHAAQRECVSAAITALEHAREKSPDFKPRQRIEHLTVCPPDLLERLKKLKPVVAIQPGFIYHSGDRYLSRTPEADKPYLFRFKSLIDGDITLAASSDTPVSPADPGLVLYGALTRKTRTGEDILPIEKVSTAEALRMYTVNAAYASGEEEIKGTIAPGRLADMVVLNHNPFDASPEEIKALKVDMTIAGGKVVWGG